MYLWMMDDGFRFQRLVRSDEGGIHLGPCSNFGGGTIVSGCGRRFGRWITVNGRTAETRRRGIRSAVARVLCRIGTDRERLIYLGITYGT